MGNNVIHSKPNCVGIDKAILYIQNEISNKLTWSGVNNIYGKVQPILRESENNKLVNVPACYDNYNEYVSDIYADDRVTSTIAFIVTDREVDNNWVRNEIDIVVSVNVEQAFNNQLRDDERALNDIMKIVQRSAYLIDRGKVKEHNKKVWQGFDYSDIKHADMHPFYVFSIGVKLDYLYDSFNPC
jgi:hypothetical protein